MFVKFSQRSRPYSAQREPHRSLIAQLVESYRADRKTKQRIIAHLGTCKAPIADPHHRHRFYARCNKVLAVLDLSPDDRTKIDAQLAARIPPLSQEELAERERALAAMGAGPDRDQFSELVSTWNAANEDERRRFIDLLRQGQAMPE